MTAPAHSPLLHYGAAVATTAGATALYWLLSPWVGDHTLVVLLAGAVALTAVNGGIGPAVLAVVIGAASITIGFDLQRQGTDLLRAFGLIVVACAAIAWTGRSIRVGWTRPSHDITRQQQMIDALPMLISYLDARGMYRLNNHAYESWFGVSRNQITGRHIRDVLGEENWSEILPSVERALAGETVRYETVAEYKAIGRREVSITCVPHSDAGVVRGFFAIVEDITERRRAEHASAHLAAVVASSNDAIVSNTLDGCVTSWNIGAERLFGYSAEEMIGQSIWQVVPDDLRSDEEIVLARLANGERVNHYDTERMTRDGRRIPISLTVSPIHGGDGRIVGISRIAHDMSDRRAAERALRDSEGRFRALADNAPMLLWRSDADNCDVWFNRCWLEFTGRRLEQELGDGWVEHLHPADRARTIALSSTRLTARETFETEYRMRRHDGEYRWIFDRGVPMFDGPDGAYSGYMGSCIDITDRRFAEEELKHTLESIGDGFFAFNAQWQFVYINELAEELLGIRRCDVMGEIFWDEFPLALGSQLEHEYRRCARGEVRNFENFYPPLNRWYHNRCFPREGGGMSVYVRDITKEKLTQRTLHESEEKFRKAFGTSPNVLAINALDTGHFLEVNEAFERLTGYGCAFAAGRTATELGLWRDAEAKATFLELLRSGTPIRDLELIVNARDGTTRTVLLSADPISIDDAPCVISSWLDITKHRELEAQLRESVSQLAEDDRRKNEFLATLAHELRNPLAPILSAAQFMQHTLPQDPALQRAREIIQRQALHMSRLVDDLLDLARISRGQVTLQREPISLQRTVIGAVEACQPQIEAAAHHLELNMCADDVMVDGDFTRLSQVLGNLIGNAVKYTPRGGSIWISLQRAGADAELRVRDSGIGIRPGMTERIFDLFTQAPQSIERSQGGLGIGLTLVRQLVELHGGRVQACSDGPGRGSEFVLSLPLSTSQPSPPMKSAAPAVALPPQRILVADDNLDAATSLAMMFELHGHDVRTVHDGHAAVAAAEQAMPDIALLDIGMPRMDGYEAARRIRDLPGGEAVRLIALTGWGQERDRRRAITAGFDVHFTKPIAFEALYRAMIRPESAHVAASDTSAASPQADHDLI